MRDFPGLYTRRLKLRSFRHSDCQAVFDIFSLEIATRYYNLATMQTLSQASELVQRRIDAFYKGSGIRWGIVCKSQDGDDTVIGSCGYANLNKNDRSVDLGYDLHPKYWNKGIMTEALTKIIDYGFSNKFSFPLNRIEALTYIEHTASVRLLKKLGFMEEGIRREYGYFKDAFHDLRSFSLLRRDWINR